MQGSLVRLRPVTREDLPRYVEWIADPEVRRHLNFYRPLSLEDEEHWFERLRGDGGQEVFAIETLEGRHIGGIGLHGIHTRYRLAEAGIFIGAKECWGRGYGTDAMRLLLAFAFDQLNLHRVFLNVHSDNLRALRSYEKCGFVLEGTLRQAAYKDGRYWDVHVMAVLKDEFERIGGEVR
ncbi:MAG: GNAT family N-acetyltransferase [Anaerolineae bacterium]|nr:GNAT family N-acetyltransferase [Anaerolineae bacterium]